MRALLKSGVVVLPFLFIFLGIRACSENAASRWQSRIARSDPSARAIVDESDLIVVAPDESWADFGRAAHRFRSQLADEFGDLLGKGRGDRMVVVIFSSLDMLQKHGGTKNVEKAYGFTDPGEAAIFLPPDPLPATLRHETVHLLMAQEHRGAVVHSPWLLEGLAQLFESYNPDEDPPRPPGVSTEKLRFIRGDTLDVQRLLDLDNYADFVNVDAPRNYLEAHVLTAFLFHERDRALLVEYVKMERSQSAGRGLTFRAIYKHDQEPFRRDLKAFVARTKSGGR